MYKKLCLFSGRSVLHNHIFLVYEDVKTIDKSVQFYTINIYNVKHIHIMAFNLVQRQCVVHDVDIMRFAEHAILFLYQWIRTVANVRLCIDETSGRINFFMATFRSIYINVTCVIRNFSNIE